MTMIRNGLIGAVGGQGGGSSSSQLAVSDGLACFAGSFSGTTFTVTHSLGTEEVIAGFRDTNGNFITPTNTQVVNASVLDVEFDTPTVGNVLVIGCIQSGLAPIAGGTTIIEGLSGIIDLDSPNGSINITTSGQIIQLNAIFTNGSGQLINNSFFEVNTNLNSVSGTVSQNTTDIQFLSGLILPDSGQTSINGLSGVTTLTSTNDGVAVDEVGQDIQLTSMFTSASGELINSISGITDGLPRTQTSIEGLSGVVNLDSPNQTITININGSTIELEGLFTQASGVLLEQTRDDIDTISGLIIPDTQTSINGLSGAVTLSATNDGLIITEVGQDIQLFTSFNSLSGVLINDIAADVAFVSGLIFPDSGQTSINGLSGQVQLASPDNTILIGDNNQTIELSGLYTQASGALLQQKCEDIDILSGLIGVGDAGQTSIQGISGIVDLDSPDESININVNGQTIELTTPTSGAPSGASYILREYNDNGHLTTARILSATSGIRIDDQGARSNSGIVVTLDFENEPAVDQVLKWDGQRLAWANDNSGSGGGESTSINGLSGMVLLTSPDGTILIGDNGQTIELSGLFTQASGAILQQKCDDIDILSGLIDSGAGGQQTTVNGLSGTVLITSPDGSILIGQDGQAIELSGLFTATSGALLEQKCNDIDTLSGLIGIGDAGQTSINGLSGVVEITSPDGSILIGDSPQSIELSGLFTASSGAVLEQKCRDIDTLSGLIPTDTDTQTSINGLSGQLTLSSTNDGLDVNEVGQDIQLTPMFTSASGELIQSISGITDGLPRSQTIVEGLSGVIDLDSPNSTILINVNGNTIELEGLFTQTSGALLEQNREDIDTISGLIQVDTQTTLNGLSGAVTISSTNDGLVITEVGQDIQIFASFNSLSGVLINDIASDVTFLSGLILPDSGQTSVNGLSGQVNITSPNATIDVNLNGQNIELEGLFTQASGALVQQNRVDIDTLSGLIPTDTDTQTSINGLSGQVNIASPNSTIDINVNGQDVELEGLFTQASGAVLQQKCQDIVAVSGITDGLPRRQTTINSASGTVSLVSSNNGLAVINSIPPGTITLSSLYTQASGSLINNIERSARTYVANFTPASGTEFVMRHGKNTQDFVWSLWRTDRFPIETMIPITVAPSGNNHVIVQLATAVSGKLVLK